MVTTQLQYFDPVSVLQKVQGDFGTLIRISDAYTQELPRQLEVLCLSDIAQCRPEPLRELIHQLHTSFGMFDSYRGQAILQQLTNTLNANLIPDADALYGLACEMIGLALHLHHYLRQHEENRRNTSDAS